MDRRPPLTVIVASLLQFGLLGCHREDTCRPPAVPSVPEVLDPAQALEDVARGHRGLLSLTEAGVGLSYVLNRSDPSGDDGAADEQGLVRRAARLCAIDDPTLPHVTTLLAQHYMPEFDYVPVTCDGLVCEAHGPIEFATSLRFVFERTSSGAVVLRSVLEVEDVSMTPEFVHAAWIWAEGAVLDLPGRCGSR